MAYIRLRLLAASALTLLVAACSQTPVPQGRPGEPLTPQFGTRGNDEATRVAVSADLGAVFVAGTTPGAPLKGSTEQNDIYLRRYGRDGALRWGVQFGNPGSNYPSGVVLDPQNRVYVVGFSVVYDGSGDDTGSGFLRQYSPDGRLLWSREVGSSEGEGTSVFGVAVDARGDLLVAGSTGGRGFISKYSSRGDNVWTKLYGQYYFRGIQIDRSGYLYTLDADGKLSKYTDAGRLLWKVDGGPGSIIEENLRVSDNALYVVGFKFWTLPDETDAYIAKFDLSGNKVWAKTFGTRAEESAYSVATDDRGSVYVTGYTKGVLGGENSGGSDVFVRKYSSTGTVTWTKQFGSPEFEVGNAITALSPSELYVGGATAGDLGAGNQSDDAKTDAFLTRVNGNGDRVWVR